ncbi:hypothetical protein L486_05288 [Kwoniella mangroviensis CBS 10435]|uniref:chitin deacetylase n=1 Tax=Kwoniella mangroviensis CBS 10435 TaxID=1331196 RepID=A0A1B9IQJ8_9TREE|nr:uncharacterized protein I203_08485 [Kwoniella mangroviensis CBS 8507]OCF57823.1 hypothetical protein L486_05288 [Kwoniella mangroviensis CBS 10435]OCF62432.1 hypothetical protein I203_08485 [Kwoniella mangroviensis CBS 8507]OCF75633.1 hypothetical protein I204_02925 [Kwoniella mangroviensis CBS 8886]
METLNRRQVTDEASAAQSIDPGTECTAYSYQPVIDVMSSFPTIWDTASLVNGDTEASSLFATINATLNSKLPNVKPKGTSTGDFSNVGYSASDPDCWWTWSQCTNPDSSLGINADHTTVPEPDTWGLGFDDGPNCSHNAFYDHLKNNGQKATMFYIGSNVMDWPLQAQRGLTDGHHICVHTWSHQYMTSFSNEEAFAELYYTRKAIKAVLGVTPTCWRPPYGDVDNRIRLIAQGLNLTNYVWSDDSEDWKTSTAGSNVTEADITANYQAVVSKASNGTYKASGPIVLTHELTNFTMSEFMSQYDSIKAAFKYVVPLASAFNITQPYTENNVSYPDFLAYTNQSSSASSSVSVSGSSTGTDTTAGASSSATSNSSGGSSTKSSGSPKLIVNFFAISVLAGLISCGTLL